MEPSVTKDDYGNIWPQIETSNVSSDPLQVKIFLKFFVLFWVCDIVLVISEYDVRLHVFIYRKNKKTLTRPEEVSESGSTTVVFIYKQTGSLNLKDP